ncbi:hypothetical protein [Solibacillus sp. FSL K6-1523]|uniref:hypothetical protein n=1 Tax=Solibacillus sp. FSL K6-1523 TaxID=2921471 RepID=UPI0030FAB210
MIRLCNPDVWELSNEGSIFNVMDGKDARQIIEPGINYITRLPKWECIFGYTSIYKEVI